MNYPASISLADEGNNWTASNNEPSSFNLQPSTSNVEGWSGQIGRWLVVALTVFLGAGPALAQTTATLSIQADQPGVQISSNLFGIFFEEINSAGDGGIYAELVRNRNFEEASKTNYWRLISSGSASGSLSADTSLPVSASNLYAARLIFSSGSGTVGAANNGWWGMNFQAGQTYDLNFYARCSAGFTGALTIRLENTGGTSTYAQATVTNLTTGWQQFSLSLVPASSDTAGRLSINLSQAGTVWLDVVSLFPRQTFHNRTNGLRPDLANMLVDLQPAFVRFPGGSWVNGDSLTNMYNWKRTIGPIGDRWVQNNLWGYYVNNGLGYHEYLQMCEDLAAEPLFVINCGMDVFSVGDSVPLAQMGPYVQDALDAIEYANGPTNSTWGAQRAAAGHPAPFNLKYIEIGNENGGTAYNDRYALFYDAIKSNYPAMNIIADYWGGLPTSRPVEIMDEHYYSTPAFFMANANRYDSYSRSGPKVYVGEYAVTSGSGNGNLAAALGEAAFMTGMERNSDIVTLSSYAPLFANLNNKNWNPDLIYFTGSQVYGTPSYHVQKMFAQNRGDTVLPLTLTFSGETNVLPHGAIGVGSWNTQVQYTNIVVTSNGVTLYQSDFTSGAPGWQVYNGTWSTSGGVYQQTAIATDCRSTTGNTAWRNYTVTLRARKTGGNEGFLILFNWLDDNNYTWWNIGGWNNTLNGIEQSVSGSKSTIGSQVAGSLQTNQWYDIRIVLNGLHLQCYLDNVLIHDAYYPSATDHRGGIGLGTWSTQVSFSNIVVTSGAQTLYQSDFTSGASGWTVYSGTWSTTGGRYRQTSSATDCRSTAGDTNWSDVTISLKARKDGGSEGFLILFNWQDNNNWTWWNLGGWGNSQHGIEQMVGGTKSTIGQAVAGSITTGVWYDIRIVLNGTRIQCYLNNVLIHDLSYPAVLPMYASAGFHNASGQIILKAANVSSDSITTTLSLNGLTSVAPQAGLVQLTSASTLDENSLAQPTKVAPVTGTITNAGTNFSCAFPANSLSIFRLQTPPTLPTLVALNANTNLNPLASSAGVPVRLSSFITNAVSVDFIVESANGTIVTNGTLQVLPGALAANISLPAGSVQPGSFFRVTLSNPVNCQLGIVRRAYFAADSATDDPFRIGLAVYPDEKLVYWTWPAATLQETTNLLGSWTSLTNAVCPIRIPEADARKFYRLAQ